MNLLVYLIAGVAGVLTYVVSLKALNELTDLRPPRLIAAIVALLTAISLVSLDNFLVTLVLLPYATLGVCLLLLPLLRRLNLSRALRRFREFLDTQTDKPVRRRQNGSARTTAKRRRPVHLRDTAPPEE